MPGPPAAARVLVLSDTHVSARAPEALANWDAAVGLADDVDLVLHAGDLTLNGAEDGADIAVAERLLDALPVPWAIVPGNHDIGDNPGPSHGPDVNGDRLTRWRDTFGCDYWTVEVGTWTVVGLDAQLLGSGLPAEAEQWAWLEDRVSSQPAGRPVLLVVHKPLAASSPEEISRSPSYRFVPTEARQRLTNLMDRVHCPLVVSGHVHQFRELDGGGRRHVWAPTTWAVLPEWAQTTVGLKRCGALLLELGSDGTAAVRLVEPPGMRQLTLGDDIADPYES